MSCGETVACFVKDPDSRLNYGFDWSDYLGDLPITQSTWELNGDATVSNDGEAVGGETNQQTEIWLTGGSAGSTVWITNRVTAGTGGGQIIDDRTLEITILQR